MKFELVACERIYWEFVRLLRIDSRVLSGFVDNKQITADEQVKYMTINACNYRIALADGEAAGFVGVVDDDIRVCTHPNFQGLGLGKFMIQRCIEIWPSGRAKVKIDNVASSKLFLSCGFLESGRDEQFVYFRPA